MKARTAPVSEFSKATTQKNLSFERQRDSIMSIQSDSERCSLHSKKLEILCLLDKVPICSSCALFGNHKNHQVMPLEDAIEQIRLKAEQIFLLYQEVTHNQQEILCQHKFMDRIKQTLYHNLA